MELELAPRRRVVADLSATFGSRVFGMALALLGNVVSARALQPVDFGRFGLVMAVVTICGTLADLGLTYTAVKFIAQYLEQKNGGAMLTARLYFVLRVLTGSATSGLLFMLARPIAGGILDKPDLTPYLQLGSLTLVALAVSSYPGMLLVAIGSFGRLGVAGVLNAAITLAGILLLLAAGSLNLTSLVLWNVALPLVSTLPAWLLLPREWLPWRIVGATGSLVAGVPTSPGTMLRTMFSFSRWIFFSNLGSIIVAQGDLLLLGRLADPATVGIYSVALSLAMRLDVLNQSLFTVLMPRASRLQGSQEMKGYLRRVFAGSAVLAVVLGLLALAAQPLIGLVYGESYTAVAPLFSLLLLVVLFDLVTSSLFLVAFPLDRPRVLALADWLRVGVLGLTGWLLIPMYAGFGAVTARLLARVTGTAGALIALRRAVLEDKQQ
ncbi:MAG TPA: oligosaccharide flippase family protein [Chloroflexia bacterium]|nr:oligosaccharide flippase family protein [Chloroflexia bacterium]